MTGRLRDLWIAAGVGLGASLVFLAFPAIDLSTSGLFYAAAASGDERFPFGDWRLLQVVREIGILTPRLVFLVILAAVVAKLVWPARRMVVPPRAALFLMVSLALGPGLLTNLILKENWGRPRPNQVVEFGGPRTYVRPWIISDGCARNCSFVSGEASSAMWTVALAALAPPAYRAAALGAAFGFFALIGTLRIMFGGHFLSDVVLAGVLTYLVVWACYRWLYVARPAFAEEARLERGLRRLGLALRKAGRRARPALAQRAARNIVPAARSSEPATTPPAE